MPQDAYTIYHTVKELNIRLKNARVDRINQPTNDTIVLYLRTFNRNEKLIISANAETARVTISTDNKEAPLQAPAFCMLLRKHLSHAIIESIEAIPYERIIKITFTAKNEMRESGTKILYAEIMSKYSNITLTEKDKILGAIKQSQSIEGLRPIFPGINYVLPVPQDKIELSDKTATLKCLNDFTGNDFANYIFNNFKGISKVTAIEIVYRYFHSANVTYDDIKKCNIDDFFLHFYNFYETHNYKPCIVISDNIKDFFIMDYTSIYETKTFFTDIVSTIDNFYTARENNKTFNEKKRKISDAVKSYEKKIRKKYQIALDKLLACKDMQNDRIYGELIISNLYRIKSGLKEVCLENFYSPDMETVIIKLDPTISPKDNAEKYFKRYAKEKKTVAAVEPQVKELEAIISYINTIYDEIELCEKLEDFIDIEEELKLAEIIKVPKSSKKIREHKSSWRIYKFNNFEINVGRNNLQNDKLTLSADRTDLWLHTKDYHSAHVIIRANNSPVPDDVLLIAAEICAYYSKASESDKIPVDYTLKKFVKKPSGTKAGTVFYSNQKTLLVSPYKHTELLIE